MDKIKFNLNEKKFFKNKKILITGHTGFVGSWITYYLVSLGCKVTGISSLNSNRNNLFSILNLKNKITHYNFDLCNENKFKKISKKNFDIVLHLAAKPLVFEGVNKPYDYIKNNIISSLNVINKIKNYKLFINFTTDKVYKNKNKNNYFYKESDELGGDDPYSYSKTCSDLLTRTWANLEKKNSKKFCNIRSGNIIGGADWNKKRIISDIVDLIFKNKKIYIRNKQSIRPWVHIIEVCICISKLIIKLSKDQNKFSEWNIGPNKKDGKNILWIIKKSLKITNKIKYIKKVIFLNKKTFEEKKYLKLDNSKIKKYINYDFKMSLYERLYLTLDWYNSFFYNKSSQEIKTKIINQINYIKKKSK